MINLQCYLLTQQIQRSIQDSKLPISLVYFILKQITLEIEKIYETQIKQEFQQFKNQQSINQKKEQQDKEN